MPIQELQNQQGLGSVLGMVGGYLAGNPARKAKQAQQEYQQGRDKVADARSDQQAKEYADNVTSQIAERNANMAHNAQSDSNTTLQNGLFQRYAAIIKAGPPKGTDPNRWAASIQAQANADGLTDENLRNQLIADGQATVAARAPKVSDVEHGLPQLVTSGKHASTPQQVEQHYLQAAARAMGSDLPPDQKKIIVEQYQKMAAAATTGQRADETGRHDRAMEGIGHERNQVSVTIAGMPSRSRGGRAGGSSAGDPQTFADVSTHLRTAKTREEAQAILDSDEGSLLSDRQYTRLQKQVDESKGTFTGTHKAAPKTSAPNARAADFNDAVSAISHGANRDSVVRRFAAKWGLTPDKADDLFP